MGRRGTTILMFAMTVFFGAYAWMTGATDEALATRGVQTDATVVDYSARDAVLRYTDQQGRQVEAYTRDVQGRPAVGEVVRIVYDPESPTDRVRDVRLGDQGFPMALLVIAAAGFGLFGVLTATGVITTPMLRRWSRKWSAR